MRVIIPMFSRRRTRGQKTVAEEVDKEDEEDKCADGVGAIRTLSRTPMTSHDETMAVEMGARIR